MSQLPDRVQDAVTREAERRHAAIGELRVEPNHLFGAELERRGGGEVVTFDRAGKIVGRKEY